MAKFAEILRNGIRKANELDNSLGNRSSYIGASDIGGCLRKAYLDKVTETKYTDETLIIFQRGHLVENIVQKALDSQGIKYHYQLELASKSHDFIKIHPDFVFCSKKECVVVECKSVSSIPDTPYSSWLLQLQLQMHLTKEHFDKNVRGYVVALNINTGEIRDFEVAYDENLVQLALKRAKNLWEALQKGEEPEAEEQLYCSKCPHRKNCPVYMKGVINQNILMPEVEKIVSLEQEKKELEKELKAKKEEVLKYLEAKNIKKAKVSDFVVTVTNSSEYTTIDTQKLKKDNPALYEKLINEYGKTIKRSSSLKIK
ncbi:Dna2/Cas4 domain-containing protein [Caminibacter sp.]